MIARRLTVCLLTCAMMPACAGGKAWAAAEPIQPAEERILDFDSHITVHQDASLTVRERIQVRCTGEEIKRGIYREIPTTYTWWGIRRVVSLDVLDVLRDGRPEPYHIEMRANGKRIYIGREDVFLEPGDYTYIIVYKTDRQLGFFQDHDELYWNVTGTDWAFPIERATATVVLPGDVAQSDLRLDAYTGPKGAKGTRFERSFDADGNAVFTTTAPLGSGEGLTISVGWPKGVVAPLTGRMKLRLFYRDNRGLAAGLLGLGIIIAYYAVMWVRVGRDPEPGVIIPLYEPPPGFSPAATRYIRRMGYDNQTFAAAVINMAVKGYLTISDRDGEYTLTRNKDRDADLAPVEKKIGKRLFGRRDKIVLKQSNHSKIGKAVSAAEKSLKRDYEKKYFLLNTRYWVPGIVISAVVLIAALLLSGTGGQSLFFAAWLLGWSFAVAALLAQAFALWRSAVYSRGAARLASVAGALIMSLFAVPFVAAEVFVLYMFSRAGSPALVGLVAVLVAVNCVFYHLMKAPTLAGRSLLDKIDGFRMFLRAAERDRLNMLNPPERTPELFEKYLPYALALDVEQEWAEQFSDVLAQAGAGGQAHSPAWYSGSSWSTMGAAGFASSFGGSFSGAIASSSTAPGSGSGGGGGGSSGGGGGGGGGGGW